MLLVILLLLLCCHKCYSTGIAATHARRLQSITTWANCYSSVQTGLKMVSGVAADYTFYNRFGSIAAVQQQFAAVYAAINVIYINTFNVQLQIGNTQINSAAGGAAVWNANGYTSANAISKQLTDFGAWRGALSNTYGLWHLFTNGYPPPVSETAATAVEFHI